MEFWRISQSLPVLDVRSPGEFARGHLPTAISVPLFSDQQRAEIGIAYKNSGRQPAVLKGLDFIGPRMTGLVETAIAQAVESQLLVHCWRGGMRSQSFAQILQLAGLEPIVLDGGYKAFRKLARQAFQLPLKLRVVSGLTGAGKTQVLHMLADAGEQVIDLEGLANHRGSAFGGIGQPAPPTTEQFENDLFSVIDELELDRPVWIEDEGNRLGAVVVPASLYHRLRESPAVCLECRTDQRVTNLLVDYGDLPPEQLMFGIGKIRKRLDGLAAQKAIAAIEAGEIADAIEISLAYYDKTYRSAMVKMPRDTTVPLNIDHLSADEIVSAMKKISLHFDQAKELSS